MGARTLKDSFSTINSSKANFDGMYSEPDPRAYFTALGALDYMIPDLAKSVVTQLLAARHAAQSDKLKVLDIGCSYGINAAMHRYPVTFNTLRRRYTRTEIKALSSDELRRLDRHYYASWPDSGVANFVGLDISEPAIQYAREVGLLRHGISADLERNELTPEGVELVRDVDAILTTGCVGYITERTFRGVVRHMNKAPWVISFVLRMFPYDAITRTLADFGLVTERLSGTTFLQRRFRDELELERTLDVLVARGIDPRGLEADGLFHAELFVSRPAADVRAMPLGELVTVSSGTQRAVGARYVMFEHEHGRRIVLEP